MLIPRLVMIHLDFADTEKNLPSDLFERILSLRQSSKKAKSILKKWLDFEKRSGTKEGEQQVLERARKFVEELQARQRAGDGATEPEEELDDEDED